MISLHNPIRAVALFACLSAMGRAANGDSAAIRREEFAQAAQEHRADTSGVRFPEGKRFVEIPFQDDANHVLIPVRVNGSRPLTFVLDTGASGAVLSNASLASTLNLHIVGEGEARGAGKGPNSRMSIADGVDFDLAGVDFTGSRLAVLQPGSALSGNSRWDGVIGRSVFTHAVVEFDWVKHLLRLYDPARYVYSGKGAVLPLTFDTSGRCYTMATAVMESGRSVPVKLVVDTGASRGLSLDVGSHPDIVLPSKTIETVLGRGGNGEITGHIGRVKSLRLGSYTLDDVLTEFPDASAGTAGLGGRQGLLGGEILRRFKVLFDYTRQQMILEPTRALKEPFEFSLSGLAFLPRKDRAQPLKIVDVFEGSPAKEAGMQRGDEVAAIDGRSVSNISDDDARTMLRRKGKAVVLTIRRGDTQFKKELTLRRFI